MMASVNTQVNPKLAAQANELVNQVFYGTMLREIHDQNKNPLFGNGPGGTTFVRQLDMELVKHMSGGKPSPIAMSLIRKLDHQGHTLRQSLHQAKMMPVPEAANFRLESPTTGEI